MMFSQIRSLKEALNEIVKSSEIIPNASLEEFMLEFSEESCEKILNYFLGKSQIDFLEKSMLDVLNKFQQKKTSKDKTLDKLLNYSLNEFLKILWLHKSFWRFF